MLLSEHFRSVPIGRFLTMWTRLRGRRVWEVPLSDGVPGMPRPALQDSYGRIRTLEVAPDGTLWLLTSNRDGRGEPVPADDRVVVLRPDEQGRIRS